MARRKQPIERVPVDVRLWTSERVAQAIKEVAMEEDRSMSQLIRTASNKINKMSLMTAQCRGPR
jgi:hypothetical protein